MIPTGYSDELVILLRVLAAVAVGALIGFERTFHGRPAGFRTYALVCVASSLLMLMTAYQNWWMTGAPPDVVQIDPTRMAQGIMTGIGFLGAGVIFKEGLTIRGRTTAASIWVTAVIGILLGIGFYLAAALGAAATLTILAAFRFVEVRLPSQFYASHSLRFERGAVMPEEELRRLLGQHGFAIENQHLAGLPEVREFRIEPMRD